MRIVGRRLANIGSQFRGCFLPGVLRGHVPRGFFLGSGQRRSRLRSVLRLPEGFGFGFLRLFFRLGW
jgi:hypothetical protein